MIISAPWRLDGTWQKIHDQLAQWVRVKDGHDPTPSAAGIDSQSLKTGILGLKELGFDGGKKIKGHKRHLMVDTLGLVMMERLENQTPATSETSSKPPSSDILQRSEHAPTESSEPGKCKAGGQPGHPGKTCKGFGRVDRYEVVRPETCACGSQEWLEPPVQVKYRQVAEFVATPIEVIEFEQQYCCCASCGTMSWGILLSFVVGEQSLGARLQTHLVWLGGYGQLSFEKQQEWLAEFGGLEVSLGTLQTTTERVADALHDVVSDLGDWVKQTVAVQCRPSG
jgi:hypothetical protein